MQYIAHRRFKDTAIGGKVNIPAMSFCEEKNGVIYYDNIPICYARSENGHQYFTRNDDGEGMLRGKLTQEITKLLQNRDEHYQERWDKVWEDKICKPYKRVEHVNHWLWNHDFFNAPIEDLRHIANLIGLKERT